MAPVELKAIHLNMAAAFPEPHEIAGLSDKEKQSLADLDRNAKFGRGYSEQQRTKPQTLGYSLADSPVGQAAWIYEKFRDWSDCNGDPTNSYSMDELLDNIMLYWLPNAGTSAARLYSQEWPPDWSGGAFARPSVPVGYSSFPGEILRPSRTWLERKYGPLIHFNELPRGGHFAAFEAPVSFVTEMRNCFRQFR